MWMRRFSRNGTHRMQMHVIVEQPLVGISLGSVRCSTTGHMPVQFDWRGPPNCHIALDSTSSEATGLQCGRYHIRATDADGMSASVTVDIRPLVTRSIVASSYAVQHASTGSARDGRVTVMGEGVDTWKRFLWSNGVETSGPTIYDTCCGIYGALPLPVNGVMPVYVHTCAPAEVSVTDHTSDVLR